MGISEQDFWVMSFAELDRALSSKKRKYKAEAQEKASYDYILADLIGRSVSRIYNSANKIPEISAVYPTIFDSAVIEDAQAKKQDELSALRFKQFADTYNKRFKGGSK